MRVSSSFPPVLLLIGALPLVPGVVLANENVVGRPQEAPAISAQDAAAAEVRPGRFFSDPRMLPERLRGVLRITDTEAFPVAPNNGMLHPFTTKNASGGSGISPVDLAPWRATGKMFMQFGARTFVCTASVIDKNLLIVRPS